MEDEKTLDERLDGLLNWLEDAAEQTGDFVAEQTPLVVSEVLAFGAATAWVQIMACASVTLAIMALACFLWRVLKDMDSKLFSLAICSIVSAIPVTGIVAGAIKLIKVNIAPRLYILDWVADKL